MSETRQLADFIATLDAAACPAAALALAKRCIAETIGCSLGGARTPPMAAAMRAARRQGEGGPATVLGQGWRTAPDRAAFLNALAANALDYDGGIIRQGHYGSTVVSAALAVGELLQSPGSQILSAVVAGYEVVTRVGEALCASVERHALVSGYGPYQGFGAAAATGERCASPEADSDPTTAPRPAASASEAASNANRDDRAGAATAAAPPAAAGSSAASLGASAIISIGAALPAVSWLDASPRGGSALIASVEGAPAFACGCAALPAIAGESPGSSEEASGFASCGVAIMGVSGLRVLRR